jgi:hypothetical protein
MTDTHRFYRRGGKLVCWRKLDDCSFASYELPNINLKNFLLHVTVRLVGGDADTSPSFAVLFNYSDIQNNYLLAGHLPQLSPAITPRPCPAGGDDGKVTFFRFIKGFQTKVALDKVRPKPFEEQNILIKSEDGTLQIWVDDQTVYFGIEDQLPSGTIGLGSGASGEVEFDNLILVDMDRPPDPH